MYQIGPGTEVAVLNSQVVPISQVVLRTGFTVFHAFFFECVEFCNGALPLAFVPVPCDVCCQRPGAPF